VGRGTARSLEYSAEMARLLRDPIRGGARPKSGPACGAQPPVRAAACLALGAVLGGQRRGLHPSAGRVATSFTSA
jgi:hypothetical protein